METVDASLVQIYSREALTFRVLMLLLTSTSRKRVRRTSIELAEAEDSDIWVLQSI